MGKRIHKFGKIYNSLHAIFVGYFESRINGLLMGNILFVTFSEVRYGDV